MGFQVAQRLFYQSYRWVMRNLFSSWHNSILTMLAVWLIWESVTRLLDWAVLNAAFGTKPEHCEGISGACWAFIGDNWGLFIFGLYPYEQRWRPTLALVLVLSLAALGLWRALRRHRLYLLAWIAMAVTVFLLIKGVAAPALPAVQTSYWGGLMLTLVMATAGIVFALPIGVLLALGRRQRKLPLVHASCVVFIEVARGVPLIAILFMASVMLPLLFPEGVSFDKLLRAQIALILFNAAYIAEIVRGGLKAIPVGQYEAASALGLGYWRATIMIVLPQALRVMIPALVSQVVSLLKDTSLVTIIGLLDIVAVTNFATSNPQWLGHNAEGLAFVAAVYWVICFSISRYAVHLEKRLDDREAH